MLTCPYCREQALEQMRGYGLVCSNCTYSHREGTSFSHEDIAIIWPRGPDDAEEIFEDLMAEFARLRSLPDQIQGQLNWIQHKVVALEEHLNSIPYGMRRKYTDLDLDEANPDLPRIVSNPDESG